MTCGFALLTYLNGAHLKAGIRVNGAVFDAARCTDDATDSTVMGILNDWESAKLRLARAAQTCTRTGSNLVENPRLAAPVPRPGAIYGAGANYRDHVLEMMAALNQPLDADPKARGLRSWHFMKPPGAVVGTGATVRLPARAKRVDYEAELAVVIGRIAKDVPIEHALDYVAGYTAANDLSARDLNNRPGIEPTSPFKFDWVAHKAFDGSCPLGPVMIPAEDIGDAGRLKIQLWVNGEIRQNSCTDQMLFGIADQIADMSGKCTLYPGDIILTGTPAGCGTASGKFLKSGDEILVKIEGIGDLITNMS